MSPEPRLALDGNRLSVAGEIDPDNVCAVRSEGERLICGHSQDIVVDLSALGAAHSVVLSMLLCWLRLAHSRNQTLALEGAGDRLRFLAALSGLDEQIPGLAGPAGSLSASSPQSHVES